MFPSIFSRRRALLSSAASKGRRYGAEALETRRLFNLDRPFQAYVGDNGEAVLWGDDKGSFHDLADTSALSGNRGSYGKPTGRGGSDYVYGGTKWNGTEVTWGYSNLLDGGLPLAAGTTLTDIKNAVVEALGLWAAVTGIHFTYVPDPGGVAVQDATNYNGTDFPTIRIGHHYIDGSSGLNVLAHCYFPSQNYSTNGRAGDLHLDDSNTWGNGTGGGINTLETILHEIGHGLGLDHANGDVSGSCPPSKPAIMDACIQGRFGGLNTGYLFLDDIQGMQSIYGSGLGWVKDDSGIAHVYGTGVASNVDGINTMVVTRATVSIFNYYQVASTYGTALISTAGLNGLVIEGMGGTDYLRIDSSWSGIPVTLNGGDGDDFIDFGFNSHDVGQINSNVQVIGGSGYDQIFAYDSATSGAQTYTVTSSRLDRTNGWGGFYYAVDLEHLFLQTGLGADTVNVNSTYANQPIVLNSAGGTDVVNVGNATNGVQGLASEVQINNTPSYTTININNGPDTGNRSWLVNDVNTDYGAITSLAPAWIVWHDPDITAVNLTMGAGTDTGSIARLHVALNVNGVTGGNLDNITIGNAGANGLQSITTRHSGGITLDNDPAYTRLTIDDNGSSIARTATLDIVGGYNVLSGLAPVQIRFDDNDTQEATIRSGSGNDTINVLRYYAANSTANTLTINTTGGDDIVNMGNTTDGVRSISAPIVVRNTPAHTTLNIANNADTTGRTVGIDFNPATELQTITGLAPAAISYRYLDIDSANGVTITNGSGVDNYLLAANARKLNLTTVTSGDNIAIGPDLSKITAEIYVRNPNSFSNVSISDANVSTPRNYWLSTQTVGSESFQSVALNGLLSTAIYLKAADVRPVTLYGGSGDDTFTLMSNSIGFDIRGNNGADTLNYGGNLVLLRKTDLIAAAASFTGGAGANVVNVNDVDYSAATGVININSTTVANNHGATLTFSDATRVTASLSNLGETLNVNDTLSSFLVDAIGGTAKDTINVVRTSAGSYVRLSPSGGFDDVTVDTTGIASNAGLQLNGSVFDLGSLTINNAGRVAQATGTASIRVKTLGFGGNGAFDLGNGALVVDYTGATQLSALRGNILTGYNAGAWNGKGINSSFNAGHPSYAIGYAEATAVRTAFPATFEAFSNIDNTSILIRSTLKGDANLDRIVDFQDLVRLAQNYNSGGKVWSQGDFNYDGTVDFNDLVALAQNYNTSFNVDAVQEAILAGATPSRLETAVRSPIGKKRTIGKANTGELLA